MQHIFSCPNSNFSKSTIFYKLGFSKGDSYSVSIRSLHYWMGSSPSCFKNPCLTVWLETKVLLEVNNEIAGASLMSNSCGEMARECPCKRITSSTD